mgnify:CR=1 FL=1
MDNTNYSKNQSNCEYKHGLLQQQLFYGNIASQFSPRVGFAYQLGSVAGLHFSYGHFLQMPSMSSIFDNKSSIIGPTDYSSGW